MNSMTEDQMRKMSTISWNMLISSLCSNGEHTQDAIHWYQYVKNRGIEVNEKTLNVLMTACSKTGFEEACLEVGNQLTLLNAPLNVFHYAVMLRATVKVRGVNEGLVWLETMEKAGVVPDVYCFKVVMQKCAEKGLTEEASVLYGKIKARRLDDAFLNELIVNTFLKKDVNQAREILLEMVVEEKKTGRAIRTFLQSVCPLPEHVTEANLVLQKIEQCKVTLQPEWITILTEHGFIAQTTPDSLQELSIEECNSMLVAWLEEGKFEQVISKFDMLLDQKKVNTKTWNLMFEAKCKTKSKAHVIDAMNLVYEMTPNDETLEILLKG